MAEKYIGSKLDACSMEDYVIDDNKADTSILVTHFTLLLAMKKNQKKKKAACIAQTVSSLFPRQTANIFWKWASQKQNIYKK